MICFKNPLPKQRKPFARERKFRLNRERIRTIKEAKKCVNLEKEDCIGENGGAYVRYICYIKPAYRSDSDRVWISSTCLSCLAWINKDRMKITEFMDLPKKPKKKSDCCLTKEEHEIHIRKLFKEHDIWFDNFLKNKENQALEKSDEPERNIEIQRTLTGLVVQC